jgi:hypothetical protein
MATAEACLVDGCHNSLTCKHPSDPKCARTAPQPDKLARTVAEIRAMDPGQLKHMIRTCSDGYRCTCGMYFAVPSGASEAATANQSREAMAHADLANSVESKKPEQVNHPSHYGGKDNPYEAIKVIAAWSLGFLLGNCVKYISRAGKKDPTKLVEDLEKARWYLDTAITRLKAKQEIF